MKTILLILIAAGWAATANAQTWEEWFRQRKTQRRYLIQQIVVLQQHLRQVKEGYRVLQTGLSTIGDIKSGNWLQHRGFFDSKLRVSDAVRCHERAAAIAAQYAKMLDRYHHWRRQLSQYPSLSDASRAYYDRIAEEILHQTLELADQAWMILTDGHYAMSDAERIAQIDLLCQQATAHTGRLIAFCDRTAASARSQSLQHAQQQQLLQQLTSSP